MEEDLYVEIEGINEPVEESTFVEPENDDCQFIVKKKDGYYKCKDKGNYIRRCKNFCKFHASVMRKDNIRRINKEMDITSSLELIKYPKWIEAKCIIKLPN